MSEIHPSAIVEDGARVGDDVSIGAFSIIGRDVVIEDGVSIDAHVIIRGHTTVGARTRIWPFAAIGCEAQDTSYKGEATRIVIGPDCIIREYATIHRGTARGRGVTTIGTRCFMMVSSHVAHDCVVGDNVILTNQATLGGHSELGDYAILGGLAAVQQRTRVGAHAFIGGVTGVMADVIPFSIALGDRARLAGLNVVGLKRRGFDRPTIMALRSAYRIVFFSSGTRIERIAAVEARFGDIPRVMELVAFLRAAANRRLARPRRKSGDTINDEADD